MESTPVTQEQFYAALSTLELRLGAKIESGVTRLEQKLDAHAADDREVAEKVIDLEATLRERAGLGRHWRTLLIPAALLTAWEITKYKFMGWK